MSDKLVRIKNRYDTATNWYKENPILAAGEIGIDSTYGWSKIGDGTTSWINLPYETEHCVELTDISYQGMTNGILFVITPMQYFNTAGAQTKMTDITANRLSKLHIHVQGYEDLIINVQDEIITEVDDVLTTTNVNGYEYIYYETTCVTKKYTMHSLTDANDTDVLTVQIGNNVDECLSPGCFCVNITGDILNGLGSTEAQISYNSKTKSFKRTQSGDFVMHAYVNAYIK